jgi:hypothetical protein
MQRYFSFEKVSGTQSDPKFGLRGVLLVIPVPGRKGSGTLFQVVYF